MSNTVRKHRFIDVYRIGENESWLSDMAAKGLHLKSIGPMFAHFERSEPEHMRYRIDFSVGKALENQRELFVGSGWEYVCSQADMCIFRSPATSNAPEIHTDPAEQAYTLEKLQRILTAQAVTTTLLTAAALCMLFFALFAGKTPFITFIEGRQLNLPIIALLYIYMIFTVVGAALSTRKLIFSLREGRGINHNADWKRLYRSRKAAMLVLGIIAPFVIALPFVQIALRKTEALPPITGDRMYICLADIESDPSLERQEFYLDNGIDLGNSVTYEWSPYAPVMLEIREQGVIPGRAWADGSREYSPSIDCKIYGLRFAWMADGLIKDLCRRYADYVMAPILDETGRQGFDHLYIREEQFWSEVFASRGSTVVRLHYYGEKETQAVIDAVLALFDRLSGDNL